MPLDHVSLARSVTRTELIASPSIETVSPVKYGSSAGSSFNKLKIANGILVKRHVLLAQLPLPDSATN